MKALILNSGLGSRMGVLASEHPKSMTEISARETILSRQLSILSELGVTDVVMTTGYYDSVLVEYCNSLDYPLDITFVNNSQYAETNYIYSIYCARDVLKDEDIILMHGDLVFEYSVLEDMLEEEASCMKVSSTEKLPQKDFKAVVCEGVVKAVGIDYFESAMEAQALYKLNANDWNIWLDNIIRFCESGNTKVYAENAFNEISDRCVIKAFDAKDRLCAEIDNADDLVVVKKRLSGIENRTVYMCFSTDIIHSGHINIIKKAGHLGKVIVGVLSDEAVASYKRFPLVPFSERRAMLSGISGIYKVVEQNKLSYRENLEKYKPDIVVHGDDWTSGIQKTIRDEVIEVINTYGGSLIEFPYSKSDKYSDIEKRARAELSTPDVRRGRLKKVLDMKGMAIALEAHSGLTGLIVEDTYVEEAGGIRQFDAIWISSLCDSTAKGKPDIELVDMTSRFRTIDDVCEVTTKPIIFDGDTGGLTEHFVYTVRSLERMGVSMVIIEDKTGLKKNSLFGNEVVQTQTTVQEFCDKISAGKNAQRTKEFMICARIESLILEQGMDDAIIRAKAYTEAGADAIMIHSRKKEPDEILEFVRLYRQWNKATPIVVVPTSYNAVYEEELKRCGVNVVIYANHLTRTGFPAMCNAAKLILSNHRAKECDDVCMAFEDIIRLIPEDI